MERLIDKGGKVWHACTLIAGIFMAISAAIIILNIVLRRFFNLPIYGSTEMVQYLGLAISSFAVVQNEWGDGNITMALFVDMIRSRKARYLLNAVELLIEAVIFTVIDWLLFRDVLTKFSGGNLTSDLKFPKWIPSLVIAAGFILLTAVLVIKAVIYLGAVKTGKEIDFNAIGRIE